MADDSPTSFALTWSELIQRLQQDVVRRAASATSRDEQAWQEIDARVRRYARIVTSQTRSVGDEDEIAQEVMLRLQSPAALQRMMAAGSPEGYLFVMVRNQAVSLLRDHGRSRSLLTALRPLLRSSSLPTEEDGLQRLEALEQELRRLTDEERHLLEMRFWKGLSIVEIAKRTNAPYSRTAVRIFRLLRRLRARISDD